MPKYKVGFANFPGDGSTSWQASAWCTKTFCKMRKDERISDVLPMYYPSDVPITMLRNRCVKDALEAGCDYLLMIDSDMFPDIDVGRDPTAQPFWDGAWEFMLRKRDAGGMPATIAAPYAGPPPHECVYIFRWKNFESNSPNPNYKLEMLEREDASWRSGIEEVAALPTGLIVYDIRTFQYLPKPWFDYEWTDEHRTQKASTEDVYQTRNASLAGCPQFVLWDSWAGHIKTKVVGKPTPLTTEAISEQFHTSIIKGRSAAKRLTFLEDLEGNGAPEGATASDVAPWVRQRCPNHEIIR